ncbi:MAG TPA: YggS family pyridoxal phosphate-dependent enzyme [Propylenella sp.]|nr:YggS family pyridoxal phosphate-dependent enzyme [Propylenella sp.]
MAHAEQSMRHISERIAAAARRAGRDPSEIRLVAVSKTFAADAIEPVLRAGHRHFGENRVQEAQGKWPGLREKYPDLKLHLIGPLQTNKVRDAVALFDAIHSIDRDKLAAELGKEMARQGRRLSSFVQVNTGEEPQKAGVAPATAADFVDRCRKVHGLGIDGLMCLPPAEEDPRPHFEMLRHLAGGLGLPFLSMGMSGDFEVAIAEGATHVRIGSAIFGARG